MGCCFWGVDLCWVGQWVIWTASQLSGSHGKNLLYFFFRKSKALPVVWVSTDKLWESPEVSIFYKTWPQLSAIKEWLCKHKPTSGWELKQLQSLLLHSNSPIQPYFLTSEMHANRYKLKVCFLTYMYTFYLGMWLCVLYN